MTKNNIVDLLSFYKLEDCDFNLVPGGLEKLTYLVSNGLDKCILKFYKKDYSEVEKEINFINILHQNNLPVPKIYNNLNNDLITCYKGICGVVFEFYEGGPITWNNINPKLSQDIARVIALMHSLMSNQISATIDNCLCLKSSKIDNSNLKIVDKKISDIRKDIENEIKKYDYKKLRICLVHSDLTRQNILVNKEKNKISTILDFGDCHNDYIVWDLAVAITHIFITKTYGIDRKALESFIQKYYSLFPLPNEERKLLIPFMKIRNINLATEVSRLLVQQGNKKKLESIKNSVLTKINTIEENIEYLSEVLEV